MSRDELRAEALAEWAQIMNDEFAARVEQPYGERPSLESPDYENYDLRGVRPRTTGWYVYDDDCWTGPYADEGEATAAVIDPTSVERFAADAVICYVARA